MTLRRMLLQLLNLNLAAMIMKDLKAKWWYFRNEWNVRTCPFNTKVTLLNRVALVKEIINF